MICQSVGLLIASVRCAKTDEPIEMLFGVCTRLGTHVIGIWLPSAAPGFPYGKGKGHFLWGPDLSAVGRYSQCCSLWDSDDAASAWLLVFCSNLLIVATGQAVAFD